MSTEAVAGNRQPWLFASLRGYRREWLTKDLIAGLTVWAVLVPEALAYATIAGVSPVIGLYAAPPALILYAAFGSSRHLVTGPMAATAALSAAAVADVATDDTSFLTFTIVLALVTGVWSFNGTGPDGEPVRLEAKNADVLRRQTDGTWRFVIDNPWGTD